MHFVITFMNSDSCSPSHDNGVGVSLRPKFEFKQAIPAVLVAAVFGHAAERSSQTVKPIDQGLLAVHRQLHPQCGWLAAAAHFLP